MSTSHKIHDGKWKSYPTFRHKLSTFELFFQDNDPERMALYPSLDYKGLYTSLLNFHDLVSQINQVTDSTIHDLNVICSPLMERNGNN